MTSATSAQCVDIEGKTKAELVYEGEKGIWFRLDLARCVASDLADYHAKKSTISIMDQRLKLQKSRADFYREESETLHTYIKEKDSMIRDLLSWTRSPILWFVIGVAVSAIVVVSVGSSL